VSLLVDRLRADGVEHVASRLYAAGFDALALEVVRIGGQLQSAEDLLAAYQQAAEPTLAKVYRVLDAG